MEQVWGEIGSLKNSTIEELRQLYDYKVPIGTIISQELVDSLNYLTQKIGKEIAVYLDRKGAVRYVAVGTNQLVKIPRLWSKRGEGGLSGLRCVHTHPSGNSSLSSADFSALINLRLDAMVALGVHSGETTASIAYLEPVDGTITDKNSYRDNLTVGSLMEISFTELVLHIERQLKFTGYGTGSEQENTLLVVIDWQNTQDVEMNEAIKELSSLADTAGLLVVDVVVQKRAKPDGAFLIGKGKLEEISLKLQNQKIDCVIFDDPLTPSQQNNLGEALGVKVIDRTVLILDIFAQRARSREGKLQVELAQLSYLLPRLIGQGTILSRLGGGVGTRGPGETKLETDRRHIRKRIEILKAQLEEVKKHRAIQNSNRTKNSIPQIALVGYTNAGKSSLLNVLAHDDLLAEDKLFATLDPTTRSIALDEGKVKVLLTDTVGFIRNLPHQLIDAFKATLEEAKKADLLLHVVDVSNDNWENHIQSVNKVLEQLQIKDKPIIMVYNKVDLLPEPPLVPSVKDNSCYISTRSGQGIEELKDQIQSYFFGVNQRLQFFIPYEQGQLLDKLYKLGQVIEINSDNQGSHVLVEINENNISTQLQKYIIME